jgi:hypothetical protein
MLKKSSLFYGSFLLEGCKKAKFSKKEIIFRADFVNEIIIKEKSNDATT